MGAHTQDVTVVGWVGSDVRAYHLDGGGTPYAQFRLASTRRLYDREAGTYRDGPTVWWTVKVWRHVADNVARSLHKGDPVVVVGRVGTSEWTSPDGPRTELVLEAVALGHDLVFGSTAFLRSTRGGTTRDADETGPAAGGTEPRPDDRLVDDPWAGAPAEALEDPAGEAPEPDAAAPGGAGRDAGGPDGTEPAQPVAGLALVGRG
ncbi:single-stranded DNA-binding protein [Cellulomonas telluris]|uniref:single-stranded DNA-binding protein n=1 Tax=Cellulomonas telluris TaxID=2306636 RepID=UPI0010A90A62|nr:single-stranded DNA-binding protein [Cellulomonas telluris]